MANPYATEAWLRNQCRLRDARIAELENALKAVVDCDLSSVPNTVHNFKLLSAIADAHDLLAAPAPEGIKPC